MKAATRDIVSAGLVAVAIVSGCDNGTADGAPRPDASDAEVADAALDVGADVGGENCVAESDVRPILNRHCTACHGARRPSAGLDLETPGVLARIASQTSVHALCRNRPIVVPGAPAEGVFMGKLLGTVTGCGDPMPPAGPLAPAELQCLARWISGAGSPPTD